MIFLPVFFGQPDAQANPSETFDENTKLIIRKYAVIRGEFEKLNIPSTHAPCALLSVVMPEYLSFSPMTGAAELIYMSVVYRADPARFGRTSFGPFQMQPDFIMSQLQAATGPLGNSLLEQARREGFPFVASHLEELSAIDVQLRLLLIFEKNFRRKFPSGTYDEMVNLYNTGSTEPSGFVFAKLHQSDRSYLGWVRYIRAVVSC